MQYVNYEDVHREVSTRFIGQAANSGDHDHSRPYQCTEQADT